MEYFESTVAIPFEESYSIVVVMRKNIKYFILNLVNGLFKNKKIEKIT